MGDKLDDRQKRCPLCAWEVGRKAADEWWCMNCVIAWDTAAVTSVFEAAQGPELGNQERIDVVEGPPGLYRFELVNIVETLPIGEPVPRKALSKIFRLLFRAMREASEHEREPDVEAENLRRFIAETELDYAQPDYPRELLVEEVRTLREARDAESRVEISCGGRCENTTTHIPVFVCTVCEAYRYPFGTPSIDHQERIEQRLSSEEAEDA